MRNKTVFAAMLCLIFCSWASAADSPVTPYVNEQTLAVVRVNVAGADLAPLEKQVNISLDDLAKAISLPPEKVTKARQEMKEAFAGANAWKGQFAAAGGREIYFIFSLADMPDPGLLVIPLTNNADGKAMAEVWKSFRPDLENEVRAGTFVAGTKGILDKYRNFKPTPRPELVEASDFAANSTIAVSLVPSSATRKVLAEMLPSLPREVGGGEISPLIAPTRWATLQIDADPAALVKLTIQTDDEASAGEAAKTINTVLDASAKQIQAGLIKEPKVAALLGDAQALIAHFRPKVAASRVTIAVDAATGAKLAGVLIPATVQARENARTMVSANNLKQIALAAMMYAEAHNGQYPPDLDTIAKQGQLPAQILNFSHGRTSGYVYLKPPAVKAGDEPSRQILAYENQDESPVIAVAFGDGHVEVMPRPSFTKALEESKKRAAEGR